MSCAVRRLVLVIAVIGAVGITGAVTRGRWWPPVRQQLLTSLGSDLGKAESSEHGEDEEHDHGHAGPGQANSIELSKQVQANIGLKLGNITLTTYEQSIAIPGMVVERPGHSTLAITAPLTGMVAEIYPMQGEAVQPGRKLFDLRLAHEELVQAQGDTDELDEPIHPPARGSVSSDHQADHLRVLAGSAGGERRDAPLAATLNSTETPK